MPVVNVKKSSIEKSFSHLSLKKIIEDLPYLGLDIEGIDEKLGIIRLEFNPNRPDFSSENGIIRGMKGLFELELGIPVIKNLSRSHFAINVNKELFDARPFIYSLAAKRSYPLTNDEIAQLVSMQEDLHNGLGRKRKRSSIGIHDLESLTFPLNYILSDLERKFTPLDSSQELTIDTILNNTEMGRKYSYLLEGNKRVPLLIDSQNVVVSLPPIINGAHTKVNTDTHNLFVEVTATNSKYAKEMLSILSYELNDLKFDLFSVTTHSPFEGEVVSPDLTPVVIEADAQFINKLVGVDLSTEEIIKCLEKSRCNGSLKGPDTIICTAPSYRGDLFGPQDLCEEVLIGLGIRNFSPQYPSTKLVGKKNNFSKVFDKIRDVMMGLGFVEILNTSIISEHMIKSSLVDTGLSKDNYIWLQDTENTQVETLRPSLISSMINTLSVNIHEKYPQFLFEIGKTFKQERSEIVEGWSLCASIAHDTTDFSEIKSNLESLMKYCFDISIQTPIASKPFLLNGHSAFVLANDTFTGYVGEIHPQVLENFNMRTLVSAFEIDLTKLMEILNLDKNGYI